MIALDNFGSTRLFANRLGSKETTIETFRKDLEYTGEKFEDNPKNKLWQLEHTEYIIANGNGQSVIGYSYCKGISNEYNIVPLQLGTTLKIGFTKESISGLTEEYKAKIVADIVYYAYFVAGGSKNMAGMREFYGIFQFALDSRNLKKVKDYIKVNTPEHYDITYTDLRLIILEYYGNLRGLDIAYEHMARYKKNLRASLLPSIFEKLKYEERFLRN